MNFFIKKPFAIFLFLLFSNSFIFANEQSNRLEYSIHPLMEDGKSALEVNLKLQGNENGVTEILLPSSWAGQDKLYLEISELHCLSADVKIQDTDQPEVKKISHPPNELIQISYLVTSREKQDVEWYYRPLIEQSYFFFFGHCFFIVPNINEQTPIQISIDWQAFPVDWALANSFGKQQQKQELFLPLSTFQHAVYIGGDFQVLQCDNEKAPIFIAIRGQWSFSNENLTHLVQTVIESQREFWNDFDFPYYLITVLPTGDDHHMGGTGLVNAFSIFIGDFSEENEEDWKWLAWLLSHEHFHTWNGIKMMSCAPEGSLFWFTEGFTEYYAVKLNYHNHLINLNDYLEHINTIMYDYYVSSVHNENNERIREDFWNNWDVQRLPYVRGFLFALQWDRKIQEISQGQYCLDDFMRALFKHTQENKLSFSQDDIQQVASLFLPFDVVEEDIKNYIVDGKTILPKENDINNGIFVEWMEDIGFNLQLTRSKGKIEGVRQDSKAFKAGLNNGQKFISYQSIDQIISVLVLDRDGNPREFVYPKELSVRLVPQYVLQESFTKTAL